MTSVVNSAYMRTVMADVIAVFLTGLKVRLFTNDVTPTRESALADFDYLAVGAGVAGAVVITWGEPWTDNDGVTHATGLRVQWTLTAPPAGPLTCYGWAAVSADLATWRFGARLDAPVVLARVGDAAFAAPDFAMGGDVIEDIIGGDGGAF